MSLSLESQIEALLFWKATPISRKKISEILKVEQEDVKLAIEELRKTLENRGLTLVEWEDEISIGTAKEMSGVIEDLTKEELDRDLGKAGLETLSIILYQSPISRVDIDYIRGVNSNFILRSLLIRGLIERVDNPKDQRSFLYKPTRELLAYLGISDIKELPDLENVRKDIENFKNAEKQN